MFAKNIKNRKKTLEEEDFIQKPARLQLMLDNILAAIEVL